jgi:hypothetical protein
LLKKAATERAGAKASKGAWKGPFFNLKSKEMDDENG